MQTYEEKIFSAPELILTFRPISEAAAQHRARPGYVRNDKGRVFALCKVYERDSVQPQTGREWQHLKVRGDYDKDRCANGVKNLAAVCCNEHLKSASKA